MAGNISVNASGNLGDKGSQPSALWENNAFWAEMVDSSDAHHLLWADGLVAGQFPNARSNRFYAASGDSVNWFSIAGGSSFAHWTELSGETGTNTAFSLVDPNRSIATYAASLGLTATTRAFFDAAAGNSRFSYNPSYTAPRLIAYIREGLTIR